MRAPGLRGRTAIALVLAVAAACVGLSWGTLAWADASHRQVIADQVGFGVVAEMRKMVDTIAEHPTSWVFLPLSVDVDTPLVVERALIPLAEKISPVQPELAQQYWFVDSEVRLKDRVPECLVPNKDWLDTGDPDRPEYMPGGFGSHTQFCGDYVMGFAYTQVPGDRGPFAWLLIHAYRLDPAESPVPALGTTLTLVSVGVVVLAALLAGIVAETVVRPVTRAGAMANAVAGGDLSVRIPVTGQDDVTAMSQAVNTMADRLTGQIAELEQANEVQRQFVSDVAHELRTPTTALLASAGALDDPQSRDQAAALVAPQLRRLAALTEDLLEISRMDAGRAQLVTDRIDLVDLIDEVAANSGAADQIVYLGPFEQPLTTDPARLRVVLRNLVANALQHGAPPVTIMLVAEDRDLAISVHDNGDGVHPELRARIFDRFVRGDASRHGTSSGLGLAIAAENARLLGGELTLEPDGSTFTLRWRLATLDRRMW